MPHTSVVGNGTIGSPTPAVVQRNSSRKQTTLTAVLIVPSMHRKQYYINSHMLAACRAYLSIATLAYLVPQQPKLVDVADAECLSH